MSYIDLRNIFKQVLLQSLKESITNLSDLEYYTDEEMLKIKRMSDNEFEDVITGKFCRYGILSNVNKRNGKTNEIISVDVVPFDNDNITYEYKIDNLTIYKNDDLTEQDFIEYFKNEKEKEFNQELEDAENKFKIGDNVSYINSFQSLGEVVSFDKKIEVVDNKKVFYISYKVKNKNGDVVDCKEDDLELWNNNYFQITDNYFDSYVLGEYQFYAVLFIYYYFINNNLIKSVLLKNKKIYNCVLECFIIFCLRDLTDGNQYTHDENENFLIRISDKLYRDFCYFIIKNNEYENIINKTRFLKHNEKLQIVDFKDIDEKHPFIQFLIQERFLKKQPISFLEKTSLGMFKINSSELNEDIEKGKYLLCCNCDNSNLFCLKLDYQNQKTINTNFNNIKLLENILNKGDYNNDCSWFKLFKEYKQLESSCNEKIKEHYGNNFVNFIIQIDVI